MSPISMPPATLPAILALVAALALGCGGDDAAPQPTPAPTEAAAGLGPAEQALAKHVETTLQRPFVEDCSKADVARDANKICAALRGERGNQRAYVIGPTFSEFSQWVILEDRGGQWAVVTASAITGDTAAVPGVPWPLRTGVDIVVAGASPCVNVRVGPSISQAAVDCIRDGTRIRLNAGPIAADGINWWQVEGRSGWISGDYLRYPDAIQ